METADLESSTIAFTTSSAGPSSCAFDVLLTLEYLAWALSRAGESLTSLAIGGTSSEVWHPANKKVP